jgi:glycosyltransferase involved in cell wall biosynthesis
MKILHIITRFNSGGTATWLNQLVDGELPKREENYLAFGKCSISESEAIPHECFQMIRIGNLQREINPLRDIRAVIELIQVIKSLKPDLVNTHTFKAGIVGRIAVKLAKSKSTTVVHTIHGHLKYGYFNPLISQLILRIEKSLERITDGFIVAGHKLLKELHDESLLRNRTFKVILPGFRCTQFHSKRKENARIKVGWLGRLTQIKRPDRVVDLAILLPDIDFYVGGSGELEPEITQESPLNLHIVGWTDPNKFWSDKDIGLLTSDNEATPYAIIEGNMHGVPFVATNVGSVEDVVVDNVNGFLASTDSKDLARKIRRLVEDYELRIQMSAMAKSLAWEKFDVNRFQAEHRDFYIHVMNVTCSD